MMLRLETRVQVSLAGVLGQTCFVRETGQTSGARDPPACFVNRRRPARSTSS